VKAAHFLSVAAVPQTHHGDRELHLLVDVAAVELEFAEVLADVKRKLPVLLGVDDSFFWPQEGDDGLKHRGQLHSPPKKKSKKKRLPGVTHQLSLLLGVAEGEGDLGLDVGRPPLPAQDVHQQVDQHVVVPQQRDAAVPVVEGHVGLQGADVGVDLTRVTLQVGLRGRSHQRSTF